MKIPLRTSPYSFPGLAEGTLFLVTYANATLKVFSEILEVSLPRVCPQTFLVVMVHISRVVWSRQAL